jgi:hypothetical protein
MSWPGQNCLPATMSRVISVRRTVGFVANAYFDGVAGCPMLAWPMWNEGPNEVQYADHANAYPRTRAGLGGHEV